ncbi:hypothetical protein Pcinc_030451 [Petrolisthes cinctipes]|uniref:Ig-like domain-containing protein n=1 Tax=Petrolisthes cinctipes TaxID=88211 RepID=A0AAE1K477_PETCI|nr:hypothetical protein Pcinc_030451 [Petrolisthes cinctipes]
MERRGEGNNSRNAQEIVWMLPEEDVYEVRVLVGEVAVLPCDLALSNPKDSVQLILWFKEGVHTPLYSYDYRDPEALDGGGGGGGGGPRETKPHHHSNNNNNNNNHNNNNNNLTARISFHTHAPRASMVLERVVLEDGGVYRCRVDHLLSPTTNTRTNLTVIVSPTRLSITWRVGDDPSVLANSSVVGPFKEGTSPTLTCTSLDGWPPPTVLWYEGDQLIDGTYSNEHTPAATPPLLPYHQTSTTNRSRGHRSLEESYKKGDDMFRRDVSAVGSLSVATNIPNKTFLPTNNNNNNRNNNNSNRNSNNNNNNSSRNSNSNRNSNNNNNHHVGSPSPLTQGSGSVFPPPVTSLVSNSLTLPSLTRGDLERRLTCRASNSNNGSHPAIASITLDMTRELDPCLLV